MERLLIPVLTRFLKYEEFFKHRRVREARMQRTANPLSSGKEACGRKVWSKHFSEQSKEENWHALLL
jgi:hypothetical protein